MMILIALLDIQIALIVQLCGEEVIYFVDCPWQWNSDTPLCKKVENKASIFQAYQAFDTCEDTNSKLIQNKFCGSTSIDIGEKYEFKMPLVDEKYGTRSIYCEYYLKTSDDTDT